MEPLLQEPATCPYTEPDQSSPCPTSYFLKSSLILSSHLRLGLPNGLFPSGFPTKSMYANILSPMRAIRPSNLSNDIKMFNILTH